MRLIVIVVLACSSMLATDLGLEVGARLKGDKDEGRVLRPVEQFHLSCRGLDNCTLSILMLNRCFTLSGETRAFAPILFQLSTAEGKLKVTKVRQGNFVRVEGQFVDGGGNYSIALVLGYGSSLFPKDRKDDPLLRDYYDVVTSFSGSMTRVDPIDHKVYTYEYDPLVGMGVTVPIECGVLLQGVHPAISEK